MTSKEAGHKAHETNLAKFGKDEPNRMGRQASWSRHYGVSAENPHTRERVYTAAEKARWIKFDAWHKANSDRSVWENPFRVAEEQAEPGFVPKADSRTIL
jgi:hypothetical protein